ncbi:hypothetical protein FA13DRAFT_1807338 [Coprinellus micaceus]|uniref:Uncharacterized protein n=1 Tax=Coprinellus micaceus TaxID=71717 RepID=A0A4Y7R8Z2_COPMI|nr:hypothetical protein FA13DRAFT_1807338 [Coprinellus micaceus]
MTVKSIPTLPAYPSSATRKSISPSQLSTLYASINNALSAVLAKGISAAGTSQAFVEKAIHTKVLHLAQTLADHGLLTDIKLLVDLAIVYGRTYPSKIRALFEKVAETSGGTVGPDIRASLVPSFIQILETGQGLYNQRKAAECIYCFILASSTSPTLLAPFARDNNFYTALARLYLPGLSTTARLYGGAHALLAAHKVTILDTLHILFKRLLTDLTSAEGPGQLAARSEVTFGAVFAMTEV